MADKVKARAVNFKDWEVRAALAGTKTQFRRVVKPRECSFDHRRDVLEWDADDQAAVILDDSGGVCIACPFGVVGDRLWVRERLVCPYGNAWYYAADNAGIILPGDSPHICAMVGWAHHKTGSDVCLPQHMPRWASRLTLEIAGVNVQRLQEISDDDIRAEGTDLTTERGVEVGTAFYQDRFETVWGRDDAGWHPWQSNPWVWVVEFKPVPMSPE